MLLVQQPYNRAGNSESSEIKVGFGGCFSGHRASLVVQVVKNLPANVGDLGSIPGWGRPPREGIAYPLQDSCLGSSIDRGAWRATVHGVAKSQTQLSD